VQAILRRAESKQNSRTMEMIGFWIVVFLLGVAAIALTIRLVPFFVFASLQVAVPLVFILGSCLGLLLVHVVHEHGPHKAHHHISTGVMLVCMFLGLHWTLSSVAQTFALTVSWIWFITGAFTLGVIVPYIFHWVVVRES